MNPYASFLGDRDPMEVVAQSPSQYRKLVDQLGKSGLTRSLAPGKWSVNVILCHLADAEIGFSFRLRQTLAEDDHTTQPWDQDKWSTALFPAQRRGRAQGLRRLARMERGLASHLDLQKRSRGPSRTRNGAA